MIRTNGPARLGFAAALLALLLAPLALGFHSAHAQGPDVAQYYGTGLAAGDTVGVTLDGAECASAAADAAGNWIVNVGASDACTLEDGDTVGFTLNGAAAEQTETWEAGGQPSDAAGISLTVAAPAPDDDKKDGPGMSDTGNAGLVTSASGSPLAAVALAILAVFGVTASRLATRRVS